MKAYSLLTPTFFHVKDAAAISQEVEFSEEEAEQALNRALEGTLFPKE